MNLNKSVLGIIGVLGMTPLISLSALAQLPNVSRPANEATTGNTTPNAIGGNATGTEATEGANNNNLRAPNPVSNPSPVTPSSIGAPSNAGNGADFGTGGRGNNNPATNAIDPTITPGTLAPGTVIQPAPGTIVPGTPGINGTPGIDTPGVGIPGGNGTQGAVLNPGAITNVGTNTNPGTAINPGNPANLGNTTSANPGGGDSGAGVTATDPRLNQQQIEIGRTDSNTVRVITPDSRVIISRNAAEPTVLINTGAKDAFTNSTRQGQTTNVTPAQPPASVFPRSECQLQEVYVTLPSLGGGACLSPEQAQNLL